MAARLVQWYRVSPLSPTTWVQTRLGPLEMIEKFNYWQVINLQLPRASDSL